MTGVPNVANHPPETRFPDSRPSKSGHARNVQRWRESTCEWRDEGERSLGDARHRPDCVTSTFEFGQPGLGGDPRPGRNFPERLDEQSGRQLRGSSANGTATCSVANPVLHLGGNPRADLVG